jgi:hypothetical protein
MKHVVTATNYGRPPRRVGAYYGNQPKPIADPYAPGGRLHWIRQLGKDRRLGGYVDGDRVERRLLETIEGLGGGPVRFDRLVAAIAAELLQEQSAAGGRYDARDRRFRRVVQTHLQALAYRREVHYVASKLDTERGWHRGQRPTKLRR